MGLFFAHSQVLKYYGTFRPRWRSGVLQYCKPQPGLPIQRGRPEIIKSEIISARATLGKNERLKSRKIIESLFKDGRSVAAFPIRITFRLLETSEFQLQAGFSASSRNFKKAVDRNRIKRLLRETYRKQKSGLADELTAANKRLAVFIIFTGKELPEFAVVEERMKAALKKLSDQLKLI